MKGQIFLVTAIFIVILLIFLRVGMMAVPDTQQTDIYDEFTNIRSEYIHVVDVSLLNSENVTDNLDDFRIFSNDYYKEKGLNHTITYNVNTTGSDTAVEFYIYLGNDKSYLSDNFTIERTVY